MSLSPTCGTAEGSLRSSGVPTGVPLAGVELGERGTIGICRIRRLPRPVQAYPYPLAPAIVGLIGRRAVYSGLRNWYT